MDRFLAEESRKQQPQQIRREGGHGPLGRQILAIQVIDTADFRVGSDELIGQLRYSIHRLEATTKAAGYNEFVCRSPGRVRPASTADSPRDQFTSRYQLSR